MRIVVGIYPSLGTRYAVGGDKEYDVLGPE
jgi:hypothetical protein